MPLALVGCPSSYDEDKPNPHAQSAMAAQTPPPHTPTPVPGLPTPTPTPIPSLPTTTTASPDGSTTFSCAAFDATSALLNAGALDYVEYRMGTTTPISVGTKCQLASNPKACISAVATMSTTMSLGVGCGNAPAPIYYVFTKGDAVGRVSNIAELMGVIGTVDTPTKAVLAARVAGYSATCQSNTDIAESPTGFDLEAFKLSASGEYIVSALHIQRDGLVLVVKDVGPTHLCDGA
jgi:hypothetical protein